MTVLQEEDGETQTIVDGGLSIPDSVKTVGGWVDPFLKVVNFVDARGCTGVLVAPGGGRRALLAFSAGCLLDLTLLLKSSSSLSLAAFDCNNCSTDRRKRSTSASKN